MNNTGIPVGWVNYPKDDPNVKYDFWKQFGDIEVDIWVVSIGDQYQVKTETFHRMSYPPPTVIIETLLLDEALGVAYQECKEWDEHLKTALY